MADTTVVTFEIADDHLDGDRTGDIALDSEGQLRALLEPFVQPGTAVVITAP